MSTDPKWATWLKRMREDPEGFREACFDAIGQADPCAICGARYVLTPTGITMTHDLVKHGADKVWVDKHPMPERFSAPERIVDPLEEAA